MFEPGSVTAFPRGKFYLVKLEDGGFLALEYQRWLSRTWLYVGRGHEIPAPGDVMPVPGHPYF